METSGAGGTDVKEGIGRWQFFVGGFIKRGEVG